MASPSGNNALATLERALPAATRARIARYAPLLLFLGLLVLCGYLAARLSWQFAAPGIVVAPAPSRGGAAGVSGGTVATPADKIVAAHLFGRANAPSASVAARNAPETSLDLTLSGVAAANREALSYAIITNGSSQGNDTYAVGAKLPGGALIREILPDRVVIAHDGRLETLRLPWSDLTTAINPANTADDTAQPVVSQGFREQLQSHPRSLAEYIRIRPYTKDGHFVGFRIYPGAKPKLFRKAGLVPGDIVTRVNGVTLDTPANSMKAIHELRQARGPVRLAILRQGHHIVVTINSGG